MDKNSIDFQLFKLAAKSHIPPIYLDTYNKPARKDVSEIRILEIYQFGSLDIFKSICLTEEETKHILFLLSNNSMQNQRNITELNKVINTEGIAKPTQISANNKKQMVWVDILTTNDIIQEFQNKIQAINNERMQLQDTSITNFELNFTKREIFLMYFVLDMATIIDEAAQRRIEVQQQDSQADIDKQKQRQEITMSAKYKLSIFFNPNFEFERGDKKY